MRYLTPLFFTSLLMISCLSCTQTDLLSEDLLFKRLSKGHGIWQVTQIEDVRYFADGTVQETDVQQPEDVYYQFYLNTELIAGTASEFEVMTIVRGTPDQLSRSKYYIEMATNERLSLQEYHTYTVLNEKRNSVTLQRMIVSPGGGPFTKRLIYLKRCASCEPLFQSVTQQTG